MRPGVEQRRRARHEVKRRQQFIELDGTSLPIDFAQRQSHRNPHEERLRQFDPHILHVQEIAVIQGLQSQVGELQVTLGTQRRTHPLQVIAAELFIEQTRLDPTAHEERKILGVARRHIALGHLFAKHFPAHRMQQQPGTDLRVRGVEFNARAGGEDDRLVDLLDRYTVINILDRLAEDGLWVHDAVKANAGGGNQCPQIGLIQRPTTAPIQYMQERLRHIGRARCAGRPFLRPFFPIQDIGPGHLMFTRTHQRQLNLILNIFDMERSTGGLVTHQRVHHTAGHLLDQLANAGTGSTLPTRDRQEGLGHRDGDLGRLEGYDCAISADHAKVRDSRRIGQGCEAAQPWFRR